MFQKKKASHGAVLSNQNFEKKQRAILFFLSNCWLEVCLRSEDPATRHLSATSFVVILIQTNVVTVPNLQVATHASTESYSLLPSSKESVFHFPVTFSIHHIFYCSFLPLSLSVFRIGQCFSNWIPRKPKGSAKGCQGSERRKSVMADEFY
jgi:hypothetical protein